MEDPEAPSFLATHREMRHPYAAFHLGYWRPVPVDATWPLSAEELPEQGLRQGDVIDHQFEAFFPATFHIFGANWIVWDQVRRGLCAHRLLGAAPGRSHLCC